MNHNNEPKTGVSLEEVIGETKVSIHNHIAYVFISDTPRAQLCITLPAFMSKLEKSQEIKKLFPFAKISFQS